MENKISLVEMLTGQSGKVVGMDGGKNAKRRLEALGLRVGENIVKQSAMMMKGPVTVKVGNTLVGLGYGIAEKVIVDVSSTQRSKK